MKKALALLSVCLLAASIFGCTGSQSADHAKDFPISVLGSVFVPDLLLATGTDTAATGNAFLALKVRMENRGTDTASPSAIGFKAVVDNEAYKCAYLKDTRTDPRFDGTDFSTSVIQAKSYVEGWTVFEVPVSVKGVPAGELRFSDKTLLGEGAYSKAPFSPSSAKRYENMSERLSVDVKSVLVTYKYPDTDGSVVAPSPDNLFVVCDLAVTNNARTKTHLFVTADNIAFVSSQKTEYLRGTVSTAPDPKTPLKGQDIQPSASARGTIIYEVPADDAYINKVVLRYSAQEAYSCLVPKNRIDVEGNNAPSAKIFSNETGFLDTEIWFDSNGSADPDGDALTYLWDFGDRSTGSDTSTAPAASHKYPKVGSYTVALKVKDIGGLEATATKGVRIIHYFTLKQSGHGYENDTQALFYGKYYVDVNLTNIGNRTRPVPSALFQVKSSDGAFFDYAGDDGRDPASLPAGAWAKWRVYFDVPKEKVPVAVIFDETVTALF
jgi:hypothetical protein